jgi:hypothetical protein
MIFVHDEQKGEDIYVQRVSKSLIFGKKTQFDLISMNIFSNDVSKYNIHHPEPLL